MRIALKKYPDGRLRPYWFGTFQRNGKTRVVTLGRIAGHPHASLSVNARGDDEFEASRQKALSALQEMYAKRQTEADQENLVQKIHELRYGARVEAFPLADMAARWEKLPRKRKPCERHLANCKLVFARFQQFMAQRAPDVTELGAVRAEQVRAFMDEEEQRRISPRTWNVTLTLLKGLFRRFEPYSDAWRGYLSKQPSKDDNSVHREPFSQEEINAVVAAAAADPDIKPLLITALCTAMRRGDVCRLHWKDVDLKQGFVTVKTSKTRELVEIPILPMLRVELEKARAGRTPPPDSFVFPIAAALYENNPDGLNARLQVILARAGFMDDEELERLKREHAKHAKLAQLPPAELRQRGLQALATAAMSTKRRERTREIFTRYLDGESRKEIARAMQSSTGIVYMRLAEMECLTGAAVVQRPALPAVHRGTTMANISKDAPRRRRASLRGWHSFRTTWITLALSAGVPEMIVRRVTGHATADVVLKHYFRPGREQFKTALAGALPKALTAGTAPDKDAEALRIIRRMTSRTCARDKARLLALLAPKKTGR